MDNNCGWDDCFTCPYPDCILGSGINKVSLAKKRRAIDLSNSGVRPKEIAKALGISKHQVFRYLKEQVKQKLEHIKSKYEEE